jgi:hypothetical protein
MFRKAIASQPTLELRERLSASFQSTNPLFSKEEMVLAIARKKKKRENKSSYFNAFVISHDNDAEELQRFISILKEERDKFNTKTQIQLLYYFKNKHWTVIDCRAAQNTLCFTLIDAANFGDCLEKTVQVILQTIPDAKISYLELEEGVEIQSKGFNCATFALDIACGLSNLQHLNEFIAPIAKPPSVMLNNHFNHWVNTGQLTSFSIDDLPLELGHMIRNMQSISDLSRLCKTKNYQANAHQSLRAYVRTHANSLGENMAVVHKRDKIKAKTVNYLQTVSNQKLEDLMERNQRFAFFAIDKDDEVGNDRLGDSDEAYADSTLSPGLMAGAAVSLFRECCDLLFSHRHDETLDASHTAPHTSTKPFF